MNGARKEARGSRGCAWSCFALRRQLGLPWLLRWKGSEHVFKADAAGFTASRSRVEALRVLSTAEALVHGTRRCPQILVE